MTKHHLSDLDAIDIILEQDLTAESLAKHLRQAYFEIKDEDENQFFLKIHKHYCNISIEESRQAIRLSMIDHVANYDENLYAKLLVATNEANSSLVNVTSFIFTHEHDGEEHIMLRVDQYISYHTALILPQFVRLLHQFEDIDVEIYFNIIKPVVEGHEAQFEANDQVWS